MPPRVESLEIHGIRGIKHAALELRGRSLCLLGENGSGKSSLVDAIELLFTGNIGHLTGVRTLSTRTHGKHVDVSEQEARVSAVFRSPSGSVARGLSGAATVDPALGEVFGALAEGGFILRRSHLLQFILTAPAERSRAMEVLMGIQDLDKVELTLIKERDNLRGAVESGKAEAIRQLAALAQSAQLPISEATPLCHFVNPSVVAAGMVPFESDDALAAMQSEGPATLGDSIALDRLKFVAALERTLTGSAIESELIQDLSTTATSVRQLDQAALRHASQVTRFLEQGLEILQTEAVESCPLCEQPVSRTDLLTRVRERMQQGVELSETATHIRTRASSISATLERCLQNTREAESRAEQLGGLAELVAALKDRCAGVSKLMDTVHELRELRAPTETQPFLAALASSEPLLSQGIARSRELAAEIHESAILNRARALELAQKAKALILHREMISSLQRSLAVAEECTRLVSTSKRETVSSLFASVHSDVARMYSSIHPDELHGSVSLELDPERRASTELKMTSFDQAGVDPRAYSSEGHLDTLGLCIFLALYSR